jgi:gamma-glutamyltranspeptidase/glutathione hydrolase
MLNISGNFDLKAAGHNSPRYIHLLAESMRRAFRSRAICRRPGLRECRSKAAVEGYANELRQTIQMDKASPSQPTQVADAAKARDDAYSVVDRNGMAVSVTGMLEAGYGSGAVVAGAGFR